MSSILSWHPAFSYITLAFHFSGYLLYAPFYDSSRNFRVAKSATDSFLQILYKRTKNMPWHILAPAAVACDIYLIRRSAHPRGTFFTLQESNFLQSKKSLDIIKAFSCRRWDLNPHDIATTGTWSLRVCQFRHFCISYLSIALSRLLIYNNRCMDKSQ